MKFRPFYETKVVAMQPTEAEAISFAESLVGADVEFLFEGRWIIGRAARIVGRDYRKLQVESGKLRVGYVNIHISDVPATVRLRI